MAAGLTEPILSGRLGKLGGLTSIYYDHYFVLDEETLQYESALGSRRMKTYYLDELEDCVRVPGKRDTDFVFVFSGKRSGPVWRISIRAKTPELAAEWYRSALRARDQLRASRAVPAGQPARAVTTSSCGTDAAPAVAMTASAAGGALKAPPPPPPPPPPPSASSSRAAGAPAPPRPPPPPPPPSAPPDASKGPKVLTAAEVMRRHLSRKANAKIVEQRDELLGALADVLSAEWATVDDALAAYDELSRRMDGLGVPVEGEDWAERLVIQKKGGGQHFDDRELALAGQAHARASALCDYAARARQLRQRSAQLRALHAALEANSELSRERRIERLHAALHSALRIYREIMLGGTADADAARFKQARIPGSLRSDGDDLLRALSATSHGAYLVAQEELSSLRREKSAAARSFRAPRVATILQQAVAVHTDVQLQLEHLRAEVPAEVGAERAELVAAIAELQQEVSARAPEQEADEGV